MRKSLGEIATHICGDLEGDPGTKVAGVAGIDTATEHDITYLADRRYRSLLSITQAACVVVARDVEDVQRPVIRVDDPQLAFVKILELFAPQDRRQPGVHSLACIESDVCLKPGVTISAFVYVGSGTRIGRNTYLGPHVSIGENVVIGKESRLEAGVVIGERVRIGDRVRIHSGAVVVEDDVEIGANAAIDRATTGETRIGRGTKIDNLVHIGHNVCIGENSLIVAQVGIGGSTSIGSNVVLAGQAGLVDHLVIGDGCIVGAQAGVTKSFPPGTTISGYPARPHHKAQRAYAALQKLPDLLRKVERLEAALEFETTGTNETAVDSEP
jgi:UDP-3-O-[3-hydroxymyristoyl] glucosamine N-acyltransferase